MYDASYKFIDSIEATVAFIESIHPIPANTDSSFLYVDLEGISLSRHGSLSIITIFVPSQNCVYLVDIHTLGASAFSAQAPSGGTLKSILESPTIIKVFFDVRNDSDALYSHYGVRLQGVEDIQLMENAARPSGRRRFLNGLAKCITYDASLPLARMQHWNAVKDKGVGLFHPSKNGSYEVFNQRPMDPVLVEYCANDVVYLPQLREKYLQKLNVAWKGKVKEETQKRIQVSQGKDYVPQSEDKKFGPWGF